MWTEGQVQGLQLDLSPKACNKNQGLRPGKWRLRPLTKNLGVAFLSIWLLLNWYVHGNFNPLELATA
jgi:hypothetical protein